MMRNMALTLGMTLLTLACEGTRPEGLGVRDGLLKPCPEKPNCVSSQASDAGHRIDPLPLKGSAPETMQRLAQTLKDMPRTKIIEQRDNYLYAEFTSALLRFVDDVEFYLPEGGQGLQVRSASRLGYSDMGVNRKRVEALRQALEKN